MMRVDDEISRASGGRVGFDVRQRKLLVTGEDGHPVAQVEITEPALRNWMQRLLLNAPDQGGGDSELEAARLLAARIRATSDAPDPQTALERLAAAPRSAEPGSAGRWRPEASRRSACC